ncbi:MAG: sigma-70 family RNA polymerase sigma factor [Anaerolineales bacterium]|nr:sigma-70 family RNA polymerase sigma factor [Anaerolineales bacterium]
MSQTPEDLELIRRADSDPDAFGELYTRYVGRIYSYIYYRTGDPQEAEDLTARVFQRAMHHIGRYRDQGVPFSAWLYRIAHNLVANWHRDRSRRQIVPLDERIVASGPSSHPEVATIMREEQRRLLDVVRTLPPDRQELLILKFVDHLSNAEIGQITGKTEGAIKSLYHRTLISLRFSLSGGEFLVPDEPGQTGQREDAEDE